MTNIEHHIPQHILKNWKTTEPKTKKQVIWVLKRDDLSIHYETLKNCCSKLYLYELYKNDLIIPNTENAIEDGLSILETIQGNIIKKIKEHKTLTNKEYNVLLLCIISQLYRNPKSIEAIKNGLYKTSQELNESISEEDLYNFSKLIAYPMNRINTKSTFYTYYTKTIQLLSKKNLYVLTLPILTNQNKYSFLLGYDIPVFGKSIIINNKVETDYYFPITPLHCLYLSTKTLTNDFYIQIDLEQALEINNHLLSLVNNDKVIGCSKEFLEQIKIEKNL